MRSIWTGTIGFGLVNIPVKLFSATESSTLDLDMLDKKDHAHIKFKRVNEDTGKEVPWNNIVKGYKYNGDYVVLTDKDFEAASPTKSKVIEISDFVLEEEIDSMYFETPYYLQPEESGKKAYILLRDALKQSGKAGLGSFVLRNKENLCVIKPKDSVLILVKIRFAEEIRKPEFSISDKTKPKATELKMALTLIDQLTGPFKPEKFKDNYHAELMKHIRAKASGKKISLSPLKVTHRKTDDIMAQLKASLKKAS